MRLKVPAGEARKAIDRAILEAVRDEHGPVFKAMFNQMDEVERTALQVERWSRPILEGRGVKSVQELEALRKSIQPMNGIYREFSHKDLNVIVNKADFEKKWFTTVGQARHLNIDTKFDEFADAINTMGEAHKLQAELLADARPIIRATKPMTQKEILAAQVETLLTHKQRMMTALKYVALKGGGARHTVVYTGVLAFRNMKSAAEKRDAFALYRDAIVATASNPTALQEHISQFVGPAAQHDMRLGVPLADGLASAHVYLRQQMPRSDDPMVRSQDFSMAEIENFLEAVGALSDPISVVMTAVDGSVSSQSVDAIRSVYPELYIDMVLDVSEFVHDYGDKLGHAQWLGLDAFTSYALGYTDAPTPALAFRLPSPQTSQQARSLGSIGGPQHRQMDIRMGTTPAQKLGAM
jgi:cellobiose-specific phosphotransferase system component IIA